MSKFLHLGIDDRLLDNLSNLEIEDPTDIQNKAIPMILERKNVLGIAPTGSGKTLAYLLPLISWLLSAKIPHNNPSVLILVPTRELVRQAAQVISHLTSGLDVKQISVYSGQNLNKLDRSLDDIVEIVVATPGLLLKYGIEKKIDLGSISVVVLDEIDRLLDLGFEEDLKTILEQCPDKRNRQTLLFGATLPKAIEKIAKRLQVNSVLVDAGRSEIPDTITHEIYEVFAEKKMEMLVKILSKREIEHVLIFTPSQESTRALARNLGTLGLEVEEIHSGLTQRQRNIAMANFNTGSVNVLIATDIGARGLDIPDISHVISFNVPKVFNDYVHRAGRTGRAGKRGKSIVLAEERELGRVSHIENLMGRKLKRIQKLPKKFTSKEKNKRDSKPRGKDGKREKRGKPIRGDRKSGKSRVNRGSRSTDRKIDRKTGRKGDKGRKRSGKTKSEIMKETRDKKYDRKPIKGKSERNQRHKGSRNSKK